MAQVLEGNNCDVLHFVNYTDKKGGENIFTQLIHFTKRLNYKETASK